ncbi:MAG: class I SAM-dependent methyltransferase, partial [Rickettsiales bacterium]
MFGFSAIPNQSAGAAVMIQVLDHLLDPVATLKELGQKLEPDGKLLLVTHNEQSILRKITNWKWPAFCLQHPQIYSPNSITKLLEVSGYKVESIRASKNYFEFSFLLKHLFWAIGFKVKSIPKLLNFQIGLKLGNIVTVASVKR